MGLNSMMRRLASFCAAAAALALAGCATSPPPFAPAASATAAGYSERQIESDRFFVTYRAPHGADAALIQDYALLRAADLTLAHGHEWFWVDRRSFDDAPGRGPSGPSIGIGVGGASFGGRSASSVGVGVNIPLGGQRPQSARASTLEIRFGQGPKPDDANAYDARAIARTLRPRLAG